LFDLTRIAIRAQRNHAHRVEMARQVETQRAPQGHVAAAATDAMMNRWFSGE